MKDYCVEHGLHRSRFLPKHARNEKVGIMLRLGYQWQKETNRKGKGLNLCTTRKCFTSPEFGKKMTAILAYYVATHI